MPCIPLANPRIERVSGRAFSIVLCLSVLAIGVLMVLARETSREAARERRASDFQKLVGGLGLGPAADPSRCAYSYDPRLAAGCPHQHGPVPGGTCFCPYHGCSILTLQPPNREVRGDPARHAQLP
jgi:hypothetical protein